MWYQIGVQKIVYIKPGSWMLHVVLNCDELLHVVTGGLKDICYLFFAQ